HWDKILNFCASILRQFRGTVIQCLTDFVNSRTAIHKVTANNPTFFRSFAKVLSGIFMKKAEATRLTILQKAFELIYVKGYQTTSIDDIIATTQVTKGAFYYHFKTKDEMGVAIINEILKPTLSNSFIKPLQKDQNPLDGIYN